MEWLQIIKSKGFIHYDETFNNVVYSNQLHNELVESDITEISLALNCGFSLHISDQPILSMPSEKSFLSGTLDLCNEFVEVKIEIKKTNLIPFQIFDQYNVLIFSKANLLTQAIITMNFALLEQTIFNKSTQPTYIIIYDQDGFTEIVKNDFIAIGDMRTLEFPFEDSENKFKTNKKIIKERNENIRWNRELSLQSPPNSYFFNDGPQNEISNLLNIKAITLCVAFTALNTEFLDEKQIYQSTFSGLKQTKFNLLAPGATKKEQMEKMYSLYEWVYSEKTADKIGLTQNIINLHIKEENNSDLEPLLSNISEIHEMIMENYRVYIQKSVKSYLDERKQVEDFIRATSNEISKQITGLTDIVTKNLFGLLATAITAVIGFNKPDNQAFIPWILYAYSFFSIALTIYYSSLANANKKAIIEVYNNRVVDYKKIFLEDRIDKITGKSIEKQTSIFRKYLHWTVWPSIGISLATIILGLNLHGVLGSLYSLIKPYINKLIEIFT